MFVLDKIAAMVLGFAMALFVVLIFNAVVVNLTRPAQQRIGGTPGDLLLIAGSSTPPGRPLCIYDWKQERLVIDRDALSAYVMATSTDSRRSADEEWDVNLMLGYLLLVAVQQQNRIDELERELVPEAPAVSRVR